jgi:hypothetical protein
LGKAGYDLEGKFLVGFGVYEISGIDDVGWGYDPLMLARLGHNTQPETRYSLLIMMVQRKIESGLGAAYKAILVKEITYVS